MEISFEKMTIDHAKEIIDIYNYYVENTTAAFPTVPQNEEDVYKRQVQGSMLIFKHDCK